MPESEHRARRNHLLVFLLFAGLTLLMTWPVAARIGTHLAGGRDDLWVHQWTFWWVREALRQGLNPFFTTYLYVPVGASLTSHNIAWLNIALWLPLQAVFGRVPAYNAVFLIAIFLNGFCMYFFAWRAIRSYGAAVVAGLIFGFWPYTLSHYDHANMMVVFWVPLTLLFLLLLFERGSDEPGRFQWALVLGTALSLAMIGITRWQLLLMSSPILVGYVLYLYLATPAAHGRTLLLELLAAAGIALAIMAPLAAPLVFDQFTRDFPEEVFLDEAIWGRTDLLAYFVPSIHNGIWQERVAPIYDNFVVNQFYTPFAGFTTLILSAVGVVRRWRKSWIWLLLALFYFMLALGPELVINGRSFPALPMPYRLVEDFFLMRMIRRPDRLNIFLSLPLAMLAGWGMQAVLAGIAGKTLRTAVAVGAAVLILLAYLPVPFATTQPQTPAWLAGVADEAGEFAILDLPINDRSYDKWYMQYQTDHGIPIATGHVSRLPRESSAFLDSVPFLANLEERDQIPDPAITDVAQQLRLLSDAGIRYLILHKAFANEGLQAVWRDWLIVDPAHEDDELLVYNTALEAGRDFTFSFGLAEEIGVVRAGFAPAEGVQGGKIRVDIVWGTAGKLREDLIICLSLTTVGAEVTKTCQALDPHAGTAAWPENDLRRASYVLPVGEDVTPGDYDLALALSDPLSGVAVGETAVLGNVAIHPFDAQAEPLGSWENGIQLMGSSTAENNGNLDLILYWQTDRALDDSYKVYVHLKDNETGDVVAQSDAIPRNWSYPTTDWQPGEIVRDIISVPLAGVPQGSYEVVIGLYDEQSGERLNLEGTSSQDGLHLATWEQ